MALGWQPEVGLGEVVSNSCVLVCEVAGGFSSSDAVLLVVGDGVVGLGELEPVLDESFGRQS